MSEGTDRDVPTAAINFRVGTVGDAVKRYGVDAASIWKCIATGETLVNPNRERVRLLADPEKRVGSTWIVEEVSA